MSVSAGLVGLPNVGKSTIFNALTNASAPAENYPFCTIDPFLACANVPDERIATLQAIYQSQNQIPATLNFVDIAGLVKGAASGEGLGNAFLSHIREVDVIIHVLRCFEDPSITYSGGDLDPIGDYEIITTELILKDLESVKKRQEKVVHQLKKSTNDKELKAEQELLIQIESALNANDKEGAKAYIEDASVTTIPLLCTKPFLIVANIDENEIADAAYTKNPLFHKVYERFGAERIIPISAKLAYELSQLSPDEAAEVSAMMGLEKSGIYELITKAFHTLNLITFFTCGPKEIHAWPLERGSTARQAGGKIHSDLERGFISADVFNCTDIFAYKTIKALKDAGKVRTEGRDYIVQDGDILSIKFNV